MLTHTAAVPQRTDRFDLIAHPRGRPGWHHQPIRLRRRRSGSRRAAIPAPGRNAAGGVRAHVHTAPVRWLGPPSEKTFETPRTPLARDTCDNLATVDWPSKIV